MDSLPTGHLCLSGAFWSGRWVSVASALCFGVKRVRTLVMSHFHNLFIDRPRGIISQCLLSVLSTSLLICMKIIISEPYRVPAVQSVIKVSKERNEAYKKGSEVSSSASWASTVLFYSKLVLVGWRKWIHFRRSKEREILFQEICACIQNCMLPIKIPHEQPHNAPPPQSARASHHLHVSSEISHLFKKQISGGE